MPCFDKLNKDHEGDNVKFEIWDIYALKDEYVSIRSIEERYPDEVVLTLADNHHMQPNGSLESITFAAPGTVLQQFGRQYRDSLFNWNIRRFLGKKGEVNAGIRDTLDIEPGHFYYYNNGVSALCEGFHFDEKSRKLRINKLQIVNGAQTVGALRYADTDRINDVLVLVKLTAIKHAARERGIAASLIKTNNTQNTLRVPDFRSNDRIQIWPEDRFKKEKGRGELTQVIYGRKRPYPRSSSTQLVLKMQDLGKIRYGWHFDPRIPIAEPARLFQLPEENGLYWHSFGSQGSAVDIWSDDEFKETLLAVHVFNKIRLELEKIHLEQPDAKQITRLRYYGLKMFKLYLDQLLPATHDIRYEELLGFGAKFNIFFERAKRIIIRTLLQSYREILLRREGTAFSLPRDQKVWDLVRRKFDDNLSLIREFSH